MEGGFGPIFEFGLQGGLIGAGMVFALIVGSQGENSYAWKPSGEAWLLLLSGGFVVGFVSALSWGIWKSYFPRPKKEEHSASDTDVR